MTKFQALLDVAEKGSAFVRAVLGLFRSPPADLQDAAGAADAIDSATGKPSDDTTELENNIRG